LSDEISQSTQHVVQFLDNYYKDALIQIALSTKSFSSREQCTSLLKGLLHFRPLDAQQQAQVVNHLLGSCDKCPEVSASLWSVDQLNWLGTLVNSQNARTKARFLDLSMKHLVTQYNGKKASEQLQDELGIHSCFIS
jgi:hypothetical protein